MIRPLFKNLLEQEVPLGFPVEVQEGARDALKRYLAERDIYCPIHWALDFLPDKHRFSADTRLSSSLLTLPIDQRMHLAHMERMIGAIDQFSRETQ